MLDETITGVFFFLPDDTEHVDVGVVSGEVDEDHPGPSVQPQVVQQVLQDGGALLSGSAQVLIEPGSAVCRQQAPVRGTLDFCLRMVAPAAEKDDADETISLSLTRSCQKLKNKRNFNLTTRYCVLRRAVDEAKVKIVLFLLVVDVETPGDLIFEVVVDVTGVVEDLDLPHSGDAQQHVLVVDEGLVSSVQGLVVVPFSPVEAIQQRALSELVFEFNSGQLETFREGWGTSQRGGHGVR